MIISQQRMIANILIPWQVQSISQLQAYNETHHDRKSHRLK